MTSISKKGSAAALLTLASLTATPAYAQAGAGDGNRWLTFTVFAVIIAITMYVTYVAAKRVRSASDFYTAGGGVAGWQNGWAIAGDYLSAASFLGIAGLISLYGYDGFMYSVGWLVAYITVLLLIAEPCRNIGRYTLSDILAYRNDPKKTRVVGALSVITVSTFYLTAQMVGGGVLVKTLIGINYETSVLCVGVLMLAYVLFGGMLATTWVQIIKAVLLVCASLVIVALVWVPYGFSLPAFLKDVVADPKVQARVATLLGDPAKAMTAAELGQRFLEPGLYFKAPIDQISLGMALVFGTAGLPHILMRFFTVRTAQQARRSVVWAMAIIGGFYVLTLFLGFGAAKNVGSANIAAVDAGGNMAAPLLAQFIGGGPDSLFGDFMLAFVSAVAFATIVAVVAGLCWPRLRRWPTICTWASCVTARKYPRADRSRPRASPRSSSGRCRSASVSPLKARMSPCSSALHSRWRRARISRAYCSRCTGSAVIPAALSPACWWARSPRSD